MSEQQPSSQQRRTSYFRGSNEEYIKRVRSGTLIPRSRTISATQYRETRKTALGMEKTAQILGTSQSPSEGGKKKTHTYKNKDYVVRIGQKGGRFILVGGKEKKKVYV